MFDPQNCIFNKSLRTEISWQSVWQKLSEIVPMVGYTKMVLEMLVVTIIRYPSCLLVAKPFLHGYISKLLTNHQYVFTKSGSTCSNLVTYIASVSPLYYTTIIKRFILFTRIFRNHLIVSIFLLQKLSLYDITGIDVDCDVLTYKIILRVYKNYQSCRCIALSGFP